MTKEIYPINFRVAFIHLDDFNYIFVTTVPARVKLNRRDLFLLSKKKKKGIFQTN